MGVEEIGVPTKQRIVHPLGASVEQPHAFEVSVLRDPGVLHGQR